MSENRGTLFGIGVGPGDPDLITMKAVKAMQDVDVIFTASSSKNSFSLAVEIARPHLPEHLEVEILPFPMTSEQGVTTKAWKENADRIAEVLKAGKNAAFLTLGDPLTYSTFGYILQYMKADHAECPVVTIPGITSFQAAAARINTPLVEAEESLVITSGAYGGEHVRRVAATSENVVLLKAYKNVDDIADALSDSGLMENSCAIKKCGREGEEIIWNVGDLREVKPDYWTLIIAKQKNGLAN
ncbi:precorrin-2 C(20)-methyltransferase [Desulfoluna butyratoxydans]|uniref:Tetrapyrrole methylase n=1 Tax=Desulfoluna butyratoxydans TaxID=231438 RepID=A0A4U8YS86_9BACT|nr:precorrin-2 C(20)-methyltransferase [Desulfoluna butyratoxydans]VFQ47245.1 tetrapyrrole methylase [Desulfoluna butyratoxydans]